MLNLLKIKIAAYWPFFLLQNALYLVERAR